MRARERDEQVPVYVQFLVGVMRRTEPTAIGGSYVVRTKVGLAGAAFMYVVAARFDDPTGANVIVDAERRRPVLGSTLRSGSWNRGIRMER